MIKLLKSAPNLPKDLKSPTVENWINGRAKTAKKRDLEAVMGAWRALPRYEFVTLSAARHDRLKELAASTGIGPAALMRGQRAHKPDSLSADAVKRWLANPETTLRRDHYEWVLARWEEIAARNQNMIALTAERIDKLAAERERTGVQPTILLKHADNAPDGLTVAVLYSWLLGKSKAARQDCYDYALSLWRSLPDRAARPQPGQLNHAGRVPLTGEAVARLAALSKKSGMGPHSLFKWAKLQGIQIPKGLSASLLRQCLKREIKTVNPAVLEFAGRTWEAACAYKIRPVPVEPWVKDKLQVWQRSGLLTEKLFVDTADMPEGLDADVVVGWLSGGDLEARSDHLEWVLARGKVLSKSSAPRVPVSAAIREKLIAERERTGVGQTRLLSEASDVPFDLRADIVSAWINGSIASARKDYLDWVLRRWEALPDG